MDLKNGKGSLTTEDKKADLRITVSDEDFFQMAMGKLNAQQVKTKTQKQMLLMSNNV